MIDSLSNVAQIIGSPSEVGFTETKASSTFFKDTVLPATATVSSLILILVIIIGGLRYTISIGDPEQIQKAKNTILYGVVGFIIVLLAYTIVNFVLVSV
ncbi:hypothetical protein KBF61_03425 [Candidatus Saccharibacteria bacterium]|jgi:hypothetical protein|nr:hypothetical protein [Candidatus Saccharibacteria bacterium]